MYKYERRILKVTILIILLAIVGISLAGCSNENGDQKNLEAKLNEEIKFLDTKIISMLNNLNNINLKNYSVVAENITQGGADAAKGTSESDGSSQSKSGGSSDSSTSGDSSSQSSKGEEKKKQNTSDIYRMKPNDILSSSKEPDWDVLKADIETLYSCWSSTVLDLYKVNANKDDILSFSNDLNQCVTDIKGENKASSMTALAKLYSYFPKYLSQFSKNNDLINQTYVKSNIVAAYSYIEQERWDDIKNKLAKAEEYYMKIANNLAGKPNEYNVNKVYIQLKEFQNSVDTHDKDILYIKYKNLIEEMN